jgi:hypothetical protein
MMIEERISMVHPAQSPSGTGMEQKPFGQRCLAGIHMSQQTSTNLLFFGLLAHTRHLFHCFFTGIIARKYPFVDSHGGFGSKF